MVICHLSLYGEAAKNKVPKVVNSMMYLQELHVTIESGKIKKDVSPQLIHFNSWGSFGPSISVMTSAM